jgi:hypothetical protein
VGAGTADSFEAGEPGTGGGGGAGVVAGFVIGAGGWLVATGCGAEGAAGGFVATGAAPTFAWSAGDCIAACSVGLAGGAAVAAASAGEAEIRAPSAGEIAPAGASAGSARTPDVAASATATLARIPGSQRIVSPIGCHRHAS